MPATGLTIDINEVEREALHVQLVGVMSESSSEATISMLMFAVPDLQDCDQFDVDWSEALEYHTHVVIERAAEAARYINRTYVERTLITTGMVVRAIHAALGKKICEFY